MGWRDEATDSGRLGSSDSPVRRDNLTVDVTTFLTPDTIQSQNDQGGWNRLDRPVGGEPVRQDHTWGSAEAE